MSELRNSPAAVCVSRRALLASAGIVGLSALLPGVVSVARAQRRGDGPSEVPLEELLKPGSQPDLVLGSADAKVTVVEYASMTCGHCAHFHNDVFPEIKKKYIDTGKIRFIMREFPLDNLAAAAAMLARCAGEGKTFPMIESLFHTQNEWAFKQGNPVPRLFEIAKQAGFTQETFDKCLTDQKLLDAVNATRQRANEKFGVNSTPSFFVNGKRLAAPTMAEFDKAIEPLLTKG